LILIVKGANPDLSPAPAAPALDIEKIRDASFFHAQRN